MNLSITLEHRFDATPDGAVWTQSAFDRAFWGRYLEVFEHLRVVARVRPVPHPPPAASRSDGKGVSFVPVPYYLGPWQYLLKAAAVRRSVSRAPGSEDAIILRVPSQISGALSRPLLRSGRPYGAEVVGDPHDVFATGAVRHPLRLLFRRTFVRRLRAECAGAAAVAYVTGQALQRRYPPSATAFVTSYSSVELPPDYLASSSRQPRQRPGPFNLLMVGSLAQMYKAPDVLIDAVGICARERIDLRLTLVGDGVHRSELERRVRNTGLDARVRFKGQIAAGAPVRVELDAADLFVLPSRQEGLPRALIEAMARGLPCIGSAVGGIPELLAADDMVPPGDAVALARRIGDVLRDPQRMAVMSARNLEKAREHRAETLAPKRLAFYAHLKLRTQQWLDATGPR